MEPKPGLLRYVLEQPYSREMVCAMLNLNKQVHVFIVSPVRRQTSFFFMVTFIYCVTDSMSVIKISVWTVVANAMYSNISFFVALLSVCFF